jgi:hypothetical protein
VIGIFSASKKHSTAACRAVIIGMDNEGRRHHLRRRCRPKYVEVWLMSSVEKVKQPIFV